MNDVSNNEEVEPEVYHAICKNCNGRSTVGYQARPCPTCAHTDHPGIVFVPVKLKDGRRNHDENK